MRTLLFSALSVMALAACGGGGSEVVTAGAGGLDVQVATITNGSAPSVAQVSAIEVCLDGGVLNASLAPAPGCINLTKVGSDWSGRFGRIRTGTYGATARAFDAAQQLLFLDARQVTIVQGQSAALVFVLNQQTTPTEIAPPQFTSITLSSLDTPRLGTVQIEVKAAGGEGALSLGGRFSSGATVATHGSLSGGGAFDGSGVARMTFTAPDVERWVWFVLQVTDSHGNVAEMGVVVFVGMAPQVGVQLQFNLAPTVSGKVRVLNDGQGAYIYFNGRVVDAQDLDPLRYEVSGPCIASPGFDYYGGTTATHLPQTATAVDLFRVTLTGASRGAPCDVSVTVRDAEGAASSLTFRNIQTAVVEPTAP